MKPGVLSSWGPSRGGEGRAASRHPRLALLLHAADVRRRRLRAKRLSLRAFEFKRSLIGEIYQQIIGMIMVI